MAKPPDKKSFEAQLADITQQIDNKQREMVGHSSSRHICPQHSMTSRVCVILESVVTAHRRGNQRQDAAVAARAGGSQHETEVDWREDPPKQRRNLEEGESCDFVLPACSHFQNPHTRAAQEYRQWYCCARCVLGLRKTFVVSVELKKVVFWGHNRTWFYDCVGVWLTHGAQLVARGVFMKLSVFYYLPTSFESSDVEAYQAWINQLVYS